MVQGINIRLVWFTLFGYTDYNIIIVDIILCIKINQFQIFELKSLKKYTENNLKTRLNLFLKLKNLTHYFPKFYLKCNWRDKIYVPNEK